TLVLKTTLSVVQSLLIPVVLQAVQVVKMIVLRLIKLKVRVNVKLIFLILILEKENLVYQYLILLMKMNLPSFAEEAVRKIKNHARIASSKNFARKVKKKMEYHVLTFKTIKRSHFAAHSYESLH